MVDMDHFMFVFLQKLVNFTHNLCLAPLAVEAAIIENSKQYFSSKIIAHRGLCSHPSMTENTLQAFELAWKVTPHIEFDLRMSSDGHLVIHHDQDLERLWGVSEKIADLNIAQVKNRFPDIPTLVELISNWQNYLYEMLPRVESIQFKPYWFIEIKSEDDPSRVDDILNSLKRVWSQVKDVCIPVFLSLDAEILRRIKGAFPNEARSFVYLVSKKQALNYINEDPECGLMGWYFNYPKNRGFSGGHHGVGFLNHSSSLNVYQGRNQKAERPLWIFTDRPDRILVKKGKLDS